MLVYPEGGIWWPWGHYAVTSILALGLERRDEIVICIYLVGGEALAVMRETRSDASDGQMGFAGKGDANWGCEERPGELAVYNLCSRESR